MLYIIQIIGLLIGYVAFVYYETRKFIMGETVISPQPPSLEEEQKQETVSPLLRRVSKGT